MRKLIVIAVLLVSAGVVRGQDFQFSQAVDAKLLMNPAHTGYFKGELRTALNFRQQWRSIATPFRSYHASADMPLGIRAMSDDDFIAGGISMARHQAGASEFGYTVANIHLAYWKALDSRARQFLTLGVSGGAGQRSLNVANLTFGSQFNGVAYDPLLPSGEVIEESSFIYPDLGVGLIWYLIPNKNFNMSIGGSLSHYNAPRLSFLTKWDRLPMKYIGHFEMDVNLGILAWQPSAYYLGQGEFEQIMVGNYLKVYLDYYTRPHPIVGPLTPVNAVSFGAWYRMDDAVILSTKLDFEWFALGVSYDMNISPLSASTSLRGGPEIFFSYVIHDWFDVGQNRRINGGW